MLTTTQINTLIKRYTKHCYHMRYLITYIKVNNNPTMLEQYLASSGELPIAKIVHNRKSGMHKPLLDRKVIPKPEKENNANLSNRYKQSSAINPAVIDIDEIDKLWELIRKEFSSFNDKQLITMKMNFNRTISTAINEGDLLKIMKMYALVDELIKRYEKKSNRLRYLKSFNMQLENLKEEYEECKRQYILDQNI